MCPRLDFSSYASQWSVLEGNFGMVVFLIMLGEIFLECSSTLRESDQVSLNRTAAERDVSVKSPHRVKVRFGAMLA